MDAKPLNKEIYEKALALDIIEIHLNFFGGYDEGHLSIFCTKEFKDDNGDVKRTCDNTLDSEIEEWAWSVYCYSGAGDGSDYGDDIVYNLKEKTVTTQEWYHTKKYDDKEEHAFALEGG
jgi:hypothetical protein